MIVHFCSNAYGGSAVILLDGLIIVQSILGWLVAQVNVVMIFFCQDFFLWILLVGHVMVARSSYQSSIQFTASSRGEQSHSVVYVLHTEELNELRSMNPWFGGSAMLVCILQLLPPLLLPGCYFLLPCTFPREAGFAPPMSSLGARWVYLHVEWWKEANDLFAAPLDWLWCRSWYFVWCWAVSCFHSFVIDKGTW